MAVPGFRHNCVPTYGGLSTDSVQTFGPPALTEFIKDDRLDLWRFIAQHLFAELSVTGITTRRRVSDHVPLLRDYWRLITPAQLLVPE